MKDSFLMKDKSIPYPDNGIKICKGQTPCVCIKVKKMWSSSLYSDLNYPPLPIVWFSYASIINNNNNHNKTTKTLLKFSSLYISSTSYCHILSDGIQVIKISSTSSFDVVYLITHVIQIYQGDKNSKKIILMST